MNSPISRPRDMPEDDELDDILNGITEGRDLSNTNSSQPAPQPRSKASRNDDGLGLDEEIVITKKRIPIPKLDDQRLLSDPGIPRLKKISKERLRFKGKGHEYGDIARMLNMYQLWLDDLYPRAKFADALTIIEKVGHSKRMQLMRRDWIDEGKPRRSTEEDDQDDGEETRESIFPTVTEQESVSADGVARNDADEDVPMNQNAEERDNPDEDELDALLAESNLPSKTVPVIRSVAREEDPFADEMEAMEGMDW